MLRISAEELDVFVLQCSKGYKGTNETRVLNEPPFNIAIDISSDTNILGLQVTYFGRRSDNSNRRFKFAHHTRLSYKLQEDMLRLIQGTHSMLNKFPVHRERRVREWYEWATGTGSGGAGFHQHELPIIAKYYGSLWDEPIHESHVLTNTDLDKVKREIIHLLQASDLIPPPATPFVLKRLSTRTRQNVSAIENGNVDVDRRVRPRLNLNEKKSVDIESESEEDDETNTSVLNFGTLKRKWFDEQDYHYICALELIAREAEKHDSNFRRACSDIDALGGKVIVPECQFILLKDLEKKVIRKKLKNFDRLKVAINEMMPAGLFQMDPNKLLLEWFVDGMRYNSGERLPRVTHSINKGNGHKQLTDESAYMLFKTYLSYDLSLSKFNGLLNSFAAYFLGRPLEMNEFSSTTTLRNWFKRLSIIERHFEALTDLETFGIKSPNGFPVLYYLISDDTNHGKHDTRHAVIKTGVYPDGKPRYIVLTSSAAITKDAKGNADLNVEVLKKHVDPDVLPFLGGGTVDNAGSARAEIHQTVNDLMDYIEEETETPELARFFGVRRRAIIIPDFFHVDNIAINESSITFSGDIVRGDFGQFHPRQFLQSIHDIHSRNMQMSQQIINKLLRDLPDEVQYTLKTCRERPQRWRVNGLYASRLLVALDISLLDGKNLIARWAAQMFILGGRVGGQDAQWMKDTCREIYKMAMSPVIKVCLTFEMELVTNYFDITHGQHAYTGEFKRRAGFITMELPYLYFDFIVPFWLTAKRDPKVCFPKTYAEIMALDDEDHKKMKLEQLQAAVQASLDKVSKNSELLLEAPLIFLLLTHPLEGPCVLRAIIAILADKEFDLNDPDVIHSDEYCDVWDDEKFNLFRYESDEDLEAMSEKDRAYFLQLKQSANEVVHFFQQFGFHRAVMRKELLSLVKENTSVRDVNSRTPLQDFQQSYPIIYESIESAFKWSASNSRIVELLHAFVRVVYDPNMPMECLDNRLNFLMGDEFRQRDERRDVAKRNRDDSLSYRPPKHLDRKETQQMQGKQLLVGAQQFHRTAIESLPMHVKDKIKIGQINKEGHTTMEQDYAVKVEDAWEGRYQQKINRGARQLDEDELDELAATTLSIHDNEWNKRGDVQFSVVTEKIATKSHFNSIKVTEGFYNEIVQVLPFIGFSLPEPTSSAAETLEAISKMTKSAIMSKDGILGKHLALVKRIATGKEENVYDVDLTNKSEDEILQVFVRADKSTKLQEMQNQVADKWKKMEDIYNLSAAEIAPKYHKLMYQEPVELEDTEDTSDSE